MDKREDLNLLKGAVDLHVHAYPDVIPRIGDEIEIAQFAKEGGMQAVLFKSAYGPNAGRVRYVNRVVPEVQSFGGVVLNPPVGGLNPFAVEAAIKLGAKAVWMPTIFSDAHLKYLKSDQALFAYRIMAKGKLPERGLSILDANHKLLPEMAEILGMIADADIILSTGHLSKDEIFILVDEAKKAGVKKILVTHPSNVVPNLSVEDQVRLSEKGAILEHCLLVTMPLWRNCGVEDIMHLIQKIGPTKCVLATDFGQAHHPPPPEGLRMFLRTLLEIGLPYHDLEQMVKLNPSKLLNLG